jgi:hypothetical protein
MSFTDQFEPYNLEGVYFETRAELDGALRTVGAAYVDSHHAYTLMHEWLTKRRGQRFEMAAHHYGAEQAAEIFATIDHLFDPSPDLSLQLPPLLAYLSTPAQQLERNSPEGGNLGTLGNMCLVFLYHCWEEKIRRTIARHHGVEESEISSQLWGDIGKIRNAITHRRAVATREVGRCAILKWFQEGDAILVTPPRFTALLNHIVRFENEELQALVDTPPPPGAKDRSFLLTAAKAQSNRLLDQIRACDPAVLQRSAAIFGPDRALDWLTSPNPALRDESPLNAASGRVLPLLDRMAGDARVGTAAQAIAVRAYRIWEAEGRPEGAALRHWLQAEAELAQPVSSRR